MHKIRSNFQTILLKFPPGMNYDYKPSCSIAAKKTAP